MQSIPLRRIGKWLLRLVVRELLEEYIDARTPAPAPVSSHRTDSPSRNGGRP